MELIALNLGIEQPFSDDCRKKSMLLNVRENTKISRMNSGEQANSEENRLSTNKHRSGTIDAHLQ